MGQARTMKLAITILWEDPERPEEPMMTRNNDEPTPGEGRGDGMTPDVPSPRNPSQAASWLAPLNQVHVAREKKTEVNSGINLEPRRR